MLSNEQAIEIKKQILKQIENFPQDKKLSAKQQIEAMTPNQLEEFLEKNKLLREPGQQKCIFCSIINNEIKSYKIDENEDAIAILEINPISKAHSLIIPKKHFSSFDKISEKTFFLAKKTSEKIKEKFGPKDTKIYSAILFNHIILNILPIYKNEDQDSERKSATPEELEEIQKQLQEKKQAEEQETKPEKLKEKKPEKLKEKIKFPKRIP